MPTVSRRKKRWSVAGDGNHTENSGPWVPLRWSLPGNRYSAWPRMEKSSQNPRFSWRGAVQTAYHLGLGPAFRWQGKPFSIAVELARASLFSLRQTPSEVVFIGLLRQCKLRTQTKVCTSGAMQTHLRESGEYELFSIICAIFVSCSGVCLRQGHGQMSKMRTK